MSRNLIQLIGQPLPPAPPLQMFKTLLQRRGYGLGLGFPGQRRNGLRQLFRFCISNVQRHTFTSTTQLTTQLHYRSKYIDTQGFLSNIR